MGLSNCCKIIRARNQHLNVQCVMAAEHGVGAAVSRNGSHFTVFFGINGGVPDSFNIDGTW